MYRVSKAVEDKRAKLGSRFLQLRESKGISRERVSQAVGCSEKTIWSFERGKTDISVIRFDLACKAIGVNPSEVLDGSSEEG